MMNSQPPAWQVTYVAAVLETDAAKGLSRIAEAEKAIERRLLDSPVPDELEHQAIKVAWKALSMLKITRSRRAHQPAA